MMPRAGPSGGVSTTAIRRGRHGFAPPPLYRLPRNNVEAFSRSPRRSDIAMICPRPHFFLRQLHGQRGSAGRQRWRGWGRGGAVYFYFFSDGGKAQVEVYGNGVLDVSFRDLPGTTIGSLSGDGLVCLGSVNLTVGSSNLDTTFARNSPRGRWHGHWEQWFADQDRHRRSESQWSEHLQGRDHSFERRPAGHQCDW